MSHRCFLPPFLFLLQQVDPPWRFCCVFNLSGIPPRGIWNGLWLNIKTRRKEKTRHPGIVLCLTVLVADEGFDTIVRTGS